MADYYSGSIDNVKRIMRQIGVGDSRVDGIREPAVELYQQEIDRLINDRLRPVVKVPLVKITRSDGTYFPGGISYIAVRWVAADIILNAMTEIDPNTSKSAVDHKANALAELDRLYNGVLIGTQRLDGQRMKTRNHFAPATVAPTQPYEGNQTSTGASK